MSIREPMAPLEKGCTCSGFMFSDQGSPLPCVFRRAASSRAQLVLLITELLTPSFQVSIHTKHCLQQAFTLEVDCLQACMPSSSYLVISRDGLLMAIQLTHLLVTLLGYQGSLKGIAEPVYMQSMLA